MIGEERPDYAYIDRLNSYLSNLWSDAHTRWEKIDSYIDQSFSLWPAGIKRPNYHPARAVAVLNHAVDQQMAFDPIVHRFPAGDGEGHQERADNLENAIRAVMVQAALESTQLIWKAAGRFMIGYGYSVVEAPYLDMAEKPTEPKKRTSETSDDFEARQIRYQHEKKQWMPIRMDVPNPSRVLIDPYERRPKEAIKNSTMAARTVADLAKKKARTRKYAEEWNWAGDPFEPIEVREYWSRWWHAVIAQGKLLYVEKNTWGFVPFNHGFAGFGMEFSDNSKGPGDLAKGILDPILEDLKMQAQSAAGRHNAVMEATFPQRGTTDDPAEMAQQVVQGDMLAMPGGAASMWWINAPNLPQWLFQSEDTIDRDIEQGTFARSLSGLKEPGVSTVGQQAILSTAAAKMFVAPLRQIEFMASVTAQNTLRLIDVIEEPITVDGYSLKPKDIEHDYNCKIAFRVIDPVMQLQQRQLGMQEVQMGLKSPESYRANDAQLEDEAGERKRILEARIRERPDVHALMEAKVMQEMGIFDELNRLNQQLSGQQAAGGLVGPNGEPIGLGAGQAGDLNSPGGAQAAVNQLRNPLTPDTAKPAPVRLPQGGI